MISLSNIIKEGEEPKKFSNEVKKHFLEIVSTYNKYQEMMDRKSDIAEIAEILGGITEAARELAVNESDDWFDAQTVKRNMSELDKLGKQFDKVAIEAKNLDQRLHGLYEDMGHILSRYYKIGEISEDQMKERLGLREMDNPCWKGYEMVGTKTKDGKEVPNCVPKNESIKESTDCGCNSVNEGKKAFKVNPGIGKAKYSISSHDGKKKHNDGSDFWDIEIFKNKVDLEKAIKKYTSNGFVKESVNEGLKHLIHVETPREIVSKDVAKQIITLAKKGVRSNEIGLNMGFIGNNNAAVDAFQKVKNKIYFDLDKNESVNEAKYPTDLKVGSVILGQGFTMLKGIEGGKYYKVVAIDDYSATLVPSDKNGNVKGSTKVRHKLDSIEGGIRTAKRGDENGIVVIKESVNESSFVKGKTYGGTKCEGGCYVGKQGLMKLIKISKDNPENVFMFRDDNYSGIQPHFIKNGEIAKATTINPSYDLEKSKVRNFKIGNDVILSVRLFESVNEAAHGYKDSTASYINNHKDEYKTAEKMNKGNEQSFYDSLSALEEKLYHPKYMIFLSNALRGYGVDMYKDPKIKNQQDAEKALFLLSK
jgi:hypothetical protein